MKLGTLFAGAGGVECGAKDIGLELSWGIERDPAIAKLSQLNGHPTIVGDVADLLDLSAIDILWASPPCQEYSGLRKFKAVDRHRDADAGLLVIPWIKRYNPKIFILENVPNYKNSDTFKYLVKFLSGYGYFVDAQILDAGDFGVPQYRRRLILRASKKLLPQLVKKPRIGWYSASKDLLLPLGKLANWQARELLKFPSSERPLLIPKSGASLNHFRPYAENSPCWTIRTQTNWASIVIGSQVFDQTIEFTSRIQSFPDSFFWFGTKSLIYKAIGNAVPPTLAKEIFCQSL